MTQRAFEAAVHWYRQEALGGRRYNLGPEMDALVFPNGMNPLSNTPVELPEGEVSPVDAQPGS